MNIRLPIVNWCSVAWYRTVMGGLLLATCTTACSHGSYRKALVDISDVENSLTVIRELNGRVKVSVAKNDEWFDAKKGRVAVMLTAPHSTPAFREGKYRMGDGGGTAGLAVALNSICDVTVLYTSYPSPSDPNYYDDNAFKRKLGDLIAEVKPVLLLDLHASHPYRPFEVDIGTMEGKATLNDKDLVPDLIKAFREEGLADISVDFFTAAKNQTVTKYAAARGVPAVQLEFSATRTTPEIDYPAAHRFAQTIEALATFLDERNLCSRRTKSGE